MMVKASDRCERTSTVTILYITSSVRFIILLLTLRVAAELDIPILINLSNRNIILHDVLVQLHCIFNGTNINHDKS